MFDILDRAGAGRRNNGPNFRHLSHNLNTEAYRASRLPLDNDGSVGELLVISAWFRTSGDTGTAYENIVNEEDSFRLWYSDYTGQFSFAFTSVAFGYYGDTYETITLNAAVSDRTQWNHAQAVFRYSQTADGGFFNQSFSNLYLFVNGELGAHGATEGYGHKIGPGPFVVGGVSHADQTDPRVRDVAIWNYIVPDFDPATAYGGRIVGTPTAFYRFRGSDSNRLLDSSGNGYHLSL